MKKQEAELIKELLDIISRQRSLVDHVMLDMGTTKMKERLDKDNQTVQRIEKMLLDA